MDDYTFLQRLFGKSSRAVRLFLFNSTLLIMIGIWLSGFDNVHWSIYFVPAFYTFAAVLGICPGMNLWRIILNESE